jgi:isopenicillin N synthase-like dioxygenase
MPKAGHFLFFPPSLPHRVEVNRSAEQRLSIAFNLGPRPED